MGVGDERDVTRAADVPALRPENHFDTIACRAAAEIGRVGAGEGLATAIAALCGGRACRIVGVDEARRLAGGALASERACPSGLRDDGAASGLAARAGAGAARASGGAVPDCVGGADGGGLPCTVTASSVDGDGAVMTPTDVTPPYEADGPVVVARPLAVDADGRLQATALRSLAQELRAQEGAEGARLLVADDTLVNPWLCRPLQMGFDVVVEDLRPWLGLDACALVARGEEALGRACALASVGRPGLRSGTDEAPVAETGEPTPCEGAGETAGAGVGVPEFCEAVSVLPDVATALSAERLATTSLSVQRRCDTAQVAAHFLAMHPAVAWVSYPGLPDDPANDGARRVLEHGFGAYLTFGLRPDAGLCASDVLARGGLLTEPVCAGGAEGCDLLAAGQAASGGVGVLTVSRLPAPSAAACTTLATLLSAHDQAGAPVLYLRAGLETPLDVVAALEACLAPAGRP